MCGSLDRASLALRCVLGLYLWLLSPFERIVSLYLLIYKMLKAVSELSNAPNTLVTWQVTKRNYFSILRFLREIGRLA